ncbi:MAG: branched-chain amino acid ABC transporter substrate-binding protein [Deltaproteobacteria bacterium]|jgi:branched-chain amino acid transport system substrate-binding protein|nr:branched-chain amino acid ABC transporter substrate-binding protein [Deltaproteobacteria bacterium]
MCRKLFPLFIFAFVFVTTNAFAQDNDTLKLGFVGALSGERSDYGRDNLYGAEFAVNDINSKGGVLGKQVELVTEDDSCAASQSEDKAQELLKRGLKFILGHSCSDSTLSGLEVYGNDVIVISGSATEARITENNDHPFFFRTTPHDFSLAQAMIHFINEKGFTKIAIIHDNLPYGETLANHLNNILSTNNTTGVRVLLLEGITAEELTQSALPSKLKDLAPQALIWCGYSEDAAKLAKNLRDAGLDTAIIGGDGIYDKKLIELGGQSVEGTFVVTHVDPSSTLAAQSATDYYKSRHPGVPTAYYYYSAASAQALFAAIEKAGSLHDLNDIKDHLHKDTVDTVIGPIHFDDNGDIVGLAISVYVVDNGEFKGVPLAQKPPENQ